MMSTTSSMTAMRSRQSEFIVIFWESVLVYVEVYIRAAVEGQMNIMTTFRESVFFYSFPSE